MSMEEKERASGPGARIRRFTTISAISTLTNRIKQEERWDRRFVIDVKPLTPAMQVPPIEVAFVEKVNPNK